MKFFSVHKTIKEDMSIWGQMVTLSGFRHRCSSYWCPIYRWLHWQMYVCFLHTHYSAGPTNAVSFKVHMFYHTDLWDRTSIYHIQDLMYSVSKKKTLSEELFWSQEKSINSVLIPFPNYIVEWSQNYKAICPVTVQNVFFPRATFLNYWCLLLLLT